MSLLGTVKPLLQYHREIQIVKCILNYLKTDKVNEINNINGDRPRFLEVTAILA